MLQGLLRNLGRLPPSVKAIALRQSSEVVAKLTHHQRMLMEAQRPFSSKKGEVYKVDDVEEEEKKHPRTKTLDFKQKIYLKDQFGRMLGLKTRQEADLIANKNNLVLIEDDTTKKIPTLRLMNPRKRIGEGDETEVLPESVGHESGLDEPSGRMARKPHKQLIFMSKVSEHDLVTKIRQAKRWVSKNQETVIRVQATTPDFRKLEQIFNEFEANFNAKTGCKINQKRITERDLKFNIVPVDQALMEKAFKDVHGGEEEDFDLDNFDPNQLLNDETILVNKKK